MQPDKRVWLFGGIVHPPSVVIARVKPRAPVRRRLPPGSRLLLAGDDHAWGLSTFLRKLCRDTGVHYDHELDEEASIESWADRRELREPVEELRPDMVLLSLAPEDGLHDKLPDLIGIVAADARAHGATLVWLRPPVRDATSKPLWHMLTSAKVPSFHSEALELPRGPDGQPSVRGYAGWAGALWQWIG